MIFGKEFRNTKEIMLLLSPGIFAIAVSDMVGHYFSGMRELKILNVKSIVGLIVTVVFSFIAIPRWGILGACIATTSSYLVSAFLLFRKFYGATTFSLKDYLVSKEEIQLLKEKGFDIGKTDSVVTPVYMKGGVEEATAMVMDIRENYKIFCSIVVYPVIPKGHIIYRLIPTAVHTQEEIDLTLKAFSETKAKLDAGAYKVAEIPDMANK